METRRVVILVVSIVLAAVAALATLRYLQGTQERANRGAALVQVFKVKKDVPKGLPGERAIAEGFIEADHIQAKFRPANAVVSRDAIRGKVALVNLSANLVLVDGLFVDPRVAQVTNSQRVEPGRVAVSVSIDGVRAVAGLLVPGDRVNIMATRNDFIVDRVSPDQARRGHGTGPATVLTLLYQNVEILFIGAVAAPQAGDTQTVASPGAGMITFSVPQEAAQRIVLASTRPGGLYLTLVPPNNPAEPVPPVGDHNLFGEPCDSLGGDNRPGTADDTPFGCVPLSPYPVTTTTTAPPPAQP